ncbi:putative Diguanylate cyclase [Georgfuchsia toluolica]|uniref:Diguanylate cyclase n=1 Tax=Georgfuchsia toluolica TaxID=424218 RepID=A0A916J2C8_9PROT|nr:GGDEF and EAL domain-containing protein [Georgfuchsia toluolica]CAG4882882.1 putative Diguanylate cyclase [Georgfuchsia toluolica]
MMKQDRKKEIVSGSLRLQAEARLASKPARPASSPLTEEILHELHILQIELEMQNEQLLLAQAGLEEARNRYLDLYEFAPVGYLILTPTGLVSAVNITGAWLLGLERKDALARRFNQFVMPEDASRWRRLFEDLIRNGKLTVEEMRLRRADNTFFPAQVSCQYKPGIGDAPPAVHLMLIDLSAGKVIAGDHHLATADLNVQDGMIFGDDTKIRHLAFHDPLTDLPNRRLMIDRLHHAMATASRTRKYCAVLFIDLDNFKTLNDTMGHDFGDQLLQLVAQRLLAAVREGDTAARLGGDEFVVILENLSEQPDESANQARNIGEKIATALKQPYPLAGQEFLSSASIGVALFNNPHDTAEELLKRADMAMYEAKSAGRNNVCFFDPAMQSLVTARIVLEEELRRALADHELQCHYQPQVDAEGRIRGAEVLLRWQHPERGMMFPASFIRVAEETGLLVPIGQWVLETACAQLKRWQDRLSPRRRFHLAVNVSARQFRQSDFVEHVHAVLEKSGVSPGSLTLEFKEQAVLADFSAGIAKLTALKKLGMHLAIDDFGTGCSSLSQLTQLPLDQLKINSSLVRNIGVIPTDEAIIQSLIDVTRHLGVEVMAEGVETEAQHVFLGQHGCHAFQGHLFGNPLLAHEFEQLLRRHWRRRERAGAPADSHAHRGVLTS